MTILKKFILNDHNFSIKAKNDELKLMTSLINNELVMDNGNDQQKIIL